MERNTKVIGSYMGHDVVLSVVKYDDVRELRVTIPGGDHENLTYRYRSSAGGRQIVWHLLALARKHGWGEVEDLAWSEEWHPRFYMWCHM